MNKSCMHLLADVMFECHQWSDEQNRAACRGDCVTRPPMLLRCQVLWHSQCWQVSAPSAECGESSPAGPFDSVPFDFYTDRLARKGQTLTSEAEQLRRLRAAVNEYLDSESGSRREMAKLVDR